MPPTLRETPPHVSVLEEILREGCVRDDAGNVLELHSHIPPELGGLIQKIITDLGASITLEIGLAFGISSLFICEAIRGRAGGRHIVMDPSEHTDEWRGIGLRNLREAGYESLIDFREEYSHQALPQLEREGVRVDFALVDGWHTFDHVMTDMFLVDRVLRVGGVMMIDDTEWPGVRKACRYFATNRRYRTLCCWGGEEGGPWAHLRQFVSALAQRVPRLGTTLKPELVVTDAALGFTPNCRCIALVKEAEDDGRLCFGHKPF